MAKYTSQKVGELHRITKKKSNIGETIAGIAAAIFVIMIIGAIAG